MMTSHIRLHGLVLILGICFMTKTSSGSISATVKCYNEMVLYADGDNIAESSEGSLWSGEIEDNTTLLAVKCTPNGARVGRILVDSSVLISDSTWKCSNTAHDNWYDTNFNDRDWSPAHVIATNWGPVNIVTPPVSKDMAFPGYSRWIWTDRQGDQTVYCRGRTGIRLHARCNDKCNIYVDGHLAGSPAGPGEIWSGTIPRTSRLIAVAAVNSEGPHGMMVVGASNGFKSSDQWRCTEKYRPGLTESDYNDSGWTTAVNQTEDGGGAISVEDIFNGATPIWAELPPNDVGFCWCRGSIECGCEYKCDVNEDQFTCVCGRGFTLNDDERTCRDIDECTETDSENNLLLHNCKGKCHNVPGTYNCSCHKGYRLDDDGHNCTDINECVTETPDCTDLQQCTDPQSTTTHDCSQECKNTPGSYSCSCYDGFESEDPDGKSCRDIDECATGTHNCSGLFLCSNLNGSFECQCAHDYTRLPEGTFACNCKDGFQLQNGEADCKKNQDGAHLPIAGITGGTSVVILVVVIVVIVVIFLKRRNRLKAHIGNPEYNENSRIRGEVNDGFHRADEAVVNAPVAMADHASEPVYDNVASADAVSRPIQVEAFPEHCKAMMQDEKWANKFMAIPSGKRGQCITCDREGIQDKLRFRNVLPYDHSRVILSTIDSDPLSDFINANYVDGYRKTDYYIATQGPAKINVPDFWRMIWEQRVEIIVMLTNCNEGRKEKCHQYWPDTAPENVGDITVRVADCQQLASFAMQTFFIERDGEKRRVTHFQFTAWPDKSVPECASGLLDFRRRVKDEEQLRKSPIVVHCSAGIGRTGAYIAIDYLLEQAEAEGVVDVCGCVNLMREKRMNMVQTVEQYAFIHTTVLESIQAGNTNIPSGQFNDVLAALKQVDPTTGNNRLQEQYELLEAMKPVLADGTFDESEKCMAKNRTPRVLAGDHARPFLAPRVGMESTYVNAVFIDGYRSRKAFLATQMPLEKTRKDLWRLVEDFKVLIIVMLNNETTEGNYFGTGQVPITIGSFSVMVTGKSSVGHQIQVRDIEVTREKTTAHVKLIQLAQDVMTPVSADSYVALFTEVQKLQKQRTSDAPILIQCPDGAERCGIFCALYCMLEKMNTEHVVDVFNAVKRIRRSRSEFIATMEQYIFLHDAARAYMAAFDIYANFK